MKVFLSSVIAGFEAYRDAAANAIESLGGTVIRSEDFQASPSTPQQVCLAGVCQADVVVLILGERYGSKQLSGLSPTHEEYREAKNRIPVSVFKRRGVKPEPDQHEFIEEVRGWNSGQSTLDFDTPTDLQRAVTRSLHEYALASTAGEPDEAEMLQRAMALVPTRRSITGLFVGIAGGPKQQILRPTQIEDAALEREISKEALFGEFAIFSRAQGTSRTIDGNTLIIGQTAASVMIDPLGSVRVTMPTHEQGHPRQFDLPVLIEEDVQERLVRILKFIGWVLDHVDPSWRVSDVAIVAGLIDQAYLGWQTRAEHARSHGSVTMGRGDEQVVVHLTPLSRRRAALLKDTDRLAEDLTVLLRRQVKS